ncbi:MAG: hypothetical protein ACPG7F_10420 [Aggregatilineales bacterium]
MKNISNFDIAVFASALCMTIVVIVLATLAENQQTDRPTTIAYLSPAAGGLEQLWISSIDNPDEAEKLTDTEGGIYNFSVSSDGRYIAYAVRNIEAGNLSDIFLLNLQTRQVQQLTNCATEQADCKSPTFQPGGDIIGYERININSDLENVGVGAVRIWLLDFSTTPFTTRPLSDNSQYIGHTPLWADSGEAIAFYSADIAQPGILIYDFGAAEGAALKYIPGNTGTMGTISPDGNVVIFPETAQLTGGSEDGDAFPVFGTHLRIADLDELELVNLTDPDTAYDDINARWHPDGTRAAITRKYSGDDGTFGYQFYLLDIETRTADTLIYSDNHTHGYMEWNSTGDKVIYQRLRLFNDDGSSAIRPAPEILVYDMQTDDNILFSDNAFHPRQVFP